MSIHIERFWISNDLCEAIDTIQVLRFQALPQLLVYDIVQLLAVFQIEGTFTYARPGTIVRAPNPVTSLARPRPTKRDASERLLYASSRKV